MRAFWYVSRQKVEALSAEGGTWLERLGVSAKMGVGPAALEAGVQPTAGPKLQKTIDRLERRLRRSGGVTPLNRIAEHQPVRFFEYQGPSVRNVSNGAFFTAAVSDAMGVLLVGSAVNVIGAPTGQSPVLSDSADPLGAIRRLFESQDLRDEADELAEVVKARRESPVWPDEFFTEETIPTHVQMAWLILMHHTGGVSLQALPHTRGVALYAGITAITTAITGARSDSEQELDPLKRVREVVVGSPIWVEQIGE